MTNASIEQTAALVKLAETSTEQSTAMSNLSKELGRLMGTLGKLTLSGSGTGPSARPSGNVEMS